MLIIVYINTLLHKMILNQTKMLHLEFFLLFTESKTENEILHLNRTILKRIIDLTELFVNSFKGKVFNN